MMHYDVELAKQIMLWASESKSNGFAPCHWKNFGYDDDIVMKHLQYLQQQAFIEFKISPQYSYGVMKHAYPVDTHTH